MDFTINENQNMITDMIQQFGKQNITPFVREWDDTQTFPVQVFKKLGELGLWVYWSLLNMEVQALAILNM